MTKGLPNRYNVLLQKQYPRWVSYAIAFLMLVGTVTMIYISFEIIVWVMGTL